MIAMRFYSYLFQGICDTIRFLGIDYTTSSSSSNSSSSSSSSIVVVVVVVVVVE